MKTPYAHTPGFTIVELLIVIVVIGILAVISAVAYTGINQSAKNAAIASIATQYVRGLTLYAAEHGSYGRTDIDGVVACMDGTTTYWSSVNGGQSQLVVAALRTTMGTLPPFPNHAFQYTLADGYYVVFILENAAACPKIAGTTALSNNLSSGKRVCRVGLPNPS
jgi:prepilin-type N-terminal cleavage/methylation domain-containing protein